MRATHYWISAAALALAACAGEIGGGGDDGGDDDQPPACPTGRSYAGFGGAALEHDRPVLAAGTDRLRIKPYAVLDAQYRAALHLTTFNTKSYKATFGAPPARWFIEPDATANTIYASFAIAFDGCTKANTGASYAAAPTAQTAEPICRDWARTFWHREPADAEVAACVSYATTKTDPADAPAKRWAYSCAAVLSASGFLAY